MKRRLFANERELRSLGNLTLTTHRVIVHARHRRGEASTSLLLDHVQWTRLASGSQPELTVVAIALGLLGAMLLVQGSYVLGSTLSSLALFMGLLNVTWRRTTMVIGSGNGRIKAWIDGDPDRCRQARSFLDAIERAAARDELAVLARTLATGSPGEPLFDARCER